MGEDPDLDPDITKDFFEDQILKLDPNLLTESGMRCLSCTYLSACCIAHLSPSAVSPSPFRLLYRPDLSPAHLSPSALLSLSFSFVAALRGSFAMSTPRTRCGS